MLRSVDITAALTLGDAPSHNPYWRTDFELSLDCFICERTGRTTTLRQGDESGTCSGDRTKGPHPASVRVSAFDVTHEKDRTSLRTVVDYWWAPFQDAKRNQASQALTLGPWVRLYLGYRCPEAGEPGAFSTQSNLVRPQIVTCEHCARPVAHSREAPSIRLLA